jgi:transposase-like protein
MQKVQTMCLERRSGDEYRWKCNHRITGKKCNYAVSVKTGTIFAGSHLSIAKICMMMCLWLDGVKIVTIQKHLRISSNKTIVYWGSFLREVLYDSIFDNKTPIGGPGTIVEIDESKFGKRKYNRGRRVDGQWIFGGVERGTGNCFLVPVEDRKATTLIPIIQEWIQPGSLIISDEWRAYNSLGQLGYEHQTVNHSVTYVNPVNGAHTNSIESIWHAAKISFSTSGRRHDFYPGYLAKFMFIRSCRAKNLDPFLELMKITAKLYSPNEEEDDLTEALERVSIEEDDINDFEEA